MIRVRIVVLLLTLVSLCAPLAFVQDRQSMTTRPPDIIDGAKTPNLVPDSAAWRLWLIAVTAEDSSKPELATRRQHAFLRMAGVVEDDLVIADLILANFKADYTSLIATYNSNVSGMSAKELRAKRDSLVQATQTSLLGALAPLSVRNLRNHINREKANMKVAREAH